MKAQCSLKLPQRELFRLNELLSLIEQLLYQSLL